MIGLAETGAFREAQLKILSRRNVKTVADLLFYFPRRYIDRSAPLDLRTTRLGDTVTFIGKVHSNAVKYGRRRRLAVEVIYQDFKVEIVFFQGIHYFEKILPVGAEAAFSGTIDTYRGRFNMTHPEIEIMTGDEFVHTGKIIPLYKITDGMRKAYITSRVLREQVHKALAEYTPKIADHLADSVRKQLNLMELPGAIFGMHFPENWDDVDGARARLAFDELLFFSALMLEQQKKRAAIKKQLVPQHAEKNEWAAQLVDGLPFQLTGDQEKAVARLNELSFADSPFGALLQGDVGSGKTLVALLTALQYMEEHIQVALMAPTEILARQHYRNFLDYVSPFPFVQIELLLGKEKAADRRAKLDRLARGETQLIIGTHSLIQKDIEFKGLGFVIIDEQHRFGVEQRTTLIQKGEHPDVLAMTATPIPRSLTLTLYGDMETILIKEKPPGRKPIDTRLFGEVDLPRLYKGVKKYVDQGQQAYIVYAVIDENEKTTWSSIMADYEVLEKQVFADYRLGLLHGRLAPEEKDRAMQKFKEGLIQVLVTTTVIEVGVDVPNATVMLIRNAEKFGLSQLHQLRGRVGRGEAQSFCILVQSPQSTAEGEQRLQAMVESEDGFYLAQKDLEIRGPGELLGLKQAGMSEFRIADLRYHGHIAEQAQQLMLEQPAIHERITGAKRWKTRFKRGLLFWQGE